MATDKPADRQADARRPRDLFISLLVLLVPVLLLVGGYQVIAGRTQPVEVDPAAALSSAEAAGLPVQTPGDLPRGWVPISAVYQPEESGNTVRVGYVTPGGSAQLVQSNAPADQLLSQVLPPGAEPAGTVEVAGRSWQLYQSPAGERALVWLEPELTVLVIGGAPERELRELAAAVG